MTPPSWHDINSPGSPFAREDEPIEAQTAEAEEEVVEEDEPEVRLVSAEWKPGPKGFRYKEACFLEVSAEFLKDTIRTRVYGQLYGIHDGQEVDLSQQVFGYIDRKRGIASMRLSHLWFVNDPHYENWKTDRKTPAKYIVKSIAHSRGEKEIDSPELEMPVEEKSSLRIRLDIDPEHEDSQDDTFRLFSTDAGKTYDQTLTVKDDKVPGDDCLDLEFTDVDTALAYTLEIDPGNEGKTYYGFVDALYEELSDVS